jgi:hypothetical protein
MPETLSKTPYDEQKANTLWYTSCAEKRKIVLRYKANAAVVRQ